MWFNYIDMVDKVKTFIFAERSSGWELHLSALSKILNYFAGAGHSNKAKFARLYLQDMLALPQTHHVLYEEFMNGNPSVK